MAPDASGLDCVSRLFVKLYGNVSIIDPYCAHIDCDQLVRRCDICPEELKGLIHVSAGFRTEYRSHAGQKPYQLNLRVRWSERCDCWCSWTDFILMNIASCSLQKEGTWRVHKNSKKRLRIKRCTGMSFCWPLHLAPNSFRQMHSGTLVLYTAYATICRALDRPFAFICQFLHIACSPNYRTSKKTSAFLYQSFMFSVCGKSLGRKDWYGFVLVTRGEKKIRLEFYVWLQSKNNRIVIGRPTSISLMNLSACHTSFNYANAKSVRK